jgi:DNA-binding winged helix-turn-helix (wHTH) protein
MNPQADSLGGFLRFGAFELDVKAGELRKHGTRIRLQEQPLKLLLYLVQKPGVIVPRQELAAQLWPEGTFVDSEHGLSVAITRVRQALRDSAESPRYIETVARRGYRFIAPVTNTSVSEAVPVYEPQEVKGSGSQTQFSPTRFQFRLALGVASILAICLAALLIFLRNRPPSYYSAVPLTSFVGSQYCPSFAPDGERVAFSWQGEREENFDIYVKQLGVGPPLRLTTDLKPDLSPAWSPDGHTIAFLRLMSDSTADVLLIPALAGGAERRVTEVAPPDPGYQNLRSLAWSPDGKSLVVSDLDAAHSDFGLSLVSVETGAKRRLTLPPPDMTTLTPPSRPMGGG